MNFYKEFDIDKSLSTQQIQDEIIKLTRVWTRRMNAPDLDKRHLAERKMEILAQAEEIFKDDKSRKEYDTELLMNEHQEVDNQQNQSERQEDNKGPDHEDYIQKALQLHREKRSREGLSLAVDVVNKFPNYAEGWNILGIIYEETGNSTDGIKSYLEALKIQPNNIIYTNNLGYLYLNLNRINDAKVMLEKSLNINPNDIRTLLFQADILESEGLYDEAIDIVKSLLDTDPLNEDYKARLADLHYYKGISYCYYIKSQDKIAIVDEESIPIIIEQMEEAKKYRYNVEYDNKIEWAKKSKEKKFDDRNKKLFAFPVIALIVMPNILGAIIAVVSGYVIYKSSLKTDWEVNREKYLDEDVTVQKAKEETQNLIKNTNKTLRQAKDLISDKIDSIQNKE